MAVCSFVSIPTPADVSLTLQTFAVALVGFSLGVKWSVLSVAVYIIIGGVGLPVFSGFRGGMQILLGPSGGFIFGFLILTALCGISVKNKALKILLGTLGILFCHLFGIIQFAVITKTGFLASFIAVSLPFILKDIVFVVLAFWLSVYVRRLFFLS